MTGFVRPEVAQLLFRWRETLVGAAAATLGVYWITSAIGPTHLLGWALLIAGCLLSIAGIQRARFRRGAGGAGVVQVVEGQLSYYGPFQGGVLAIENLARLELEPAGAEKACWVLTQAGGETLKIPVNAEGAEALFDVFAALPGLSTEKMLSQLARAPRTRVSIWQKQAPRLH